MAASDTVVILELTTNLPKLHSLCEDVVINQFLIDNTLDTWKCFDAIGVLKLKKLQVAGFISEHLNDIQHLDKRFFEDPEIIAILLNVINFLKEEVNHMRQEY